MDFCAQRVGRRFVSGSALQAICCWARSKRMATIASRMCAGCKAELDDFMSRSLAMCCPYDVHLAVECHIF
eukprot:4713013-Amphidinium_carterae.1